MISMAITARNIYPIKDNNISIMFTIKFRLKTSETIINIAPAPTVISSHLNIIIIQLSIHPNDSIFSI